MRWILSVAAFLLGAAAFLSSSQAATIEVDLSTQTMHVSSSSGDYDWPISSARAGYVTPNGTYGVQRMEAMHRSHKYHNSPMPHSIFFRGGYAIHGTYETAELGAPASHGCIRIAPAHAAMLYDIVKQEGARIHITGAVPGRTYASASRHHHGTALYAARRIHTMHAFGYADSPEATPSVQSWMRHPVGGYGYDYGYGADQY